MPEGIKIDILSALEGSKIKEDQLEVLANYGELADQTDFVAATCGDILHDEKGKPYPCSVRVYTKDTERYIGHINEDFRGGVVIRQQHDWFIFTTDARYIEAAIRPVLRLSPEMFELITKKKYKLKDNVDAVDFGEYIQDAVKGADYTINRLYKKTKLNQLNETYTYNIHKNYGMVEKDREFDFRKLEVYEYKGKKYVFPLVHFYTISEIGGYKYSKLSDNKTHGDGDYVWFEVKPVRWLIDYKTMSLVSEKCLIAGIPMCITDSYNMPFEETFMYEFLRNTFLPDLLQNETILNEKPKKDGVEGLLDEIFSYEKYYLGEDDIYGKVSSLIEEYNNNLQALNNENNSLELKVGVKDVNYLRTKLDQNLMEILDILKSDYEKAKPHNDMIDIVSGIQKDELSDFINCIREALNNPLLEGDKERLSDKLDSLIKDCIERNKGYIEEVKNGKPSKSLEDLKKEFRSDLQPFLEEINSIVEKKDIVKEIMNGIKSIINDEYVESNNLRVKCLLDIIKEVSDKIKEKGTPEDNIKLRELINFEIDYSEDILTILNKLNERVKLIYRIELDIKERQQNATIVRKNMINVDLSKYKDNSERG